MSTLLCFMAFSILIRSPKNKHVFWLTIVNVHITMCLRVLRDALVSRSRATASERAMVRAIVNGLVRRALFRSSCLARTNIFREESAARATSKKFRRVTM